MLPKGHQTLLFLREMQTALITNRPRSSLFSAGTGVSFALPATQTLKEEKGLVLALSAPHLCVPCEHHQLKSRNEGFGFCCNTQTKIRRSQSRGWRGNGML